MSGTDYTQTINYGLYKPISNADVNAWGGHLNANADTLDSLMHGFLPLSGGTVTGSIRGTANQALGSGGLFNGYTMFTSALSGKRTGGDACLALIGTTSDTMDAGAGGLVGQSISIHSGGVGTGGNRVGQYIDFHYAGGSDRSLGYGGQYGGHWNYSYGEGNAGGTSTSDVYGVLWGGLSSGRLTSGATNWAGCCGHEFNVGVAAGASAAYVNAITIAVQYHQQAPQVTDGLITMAKTFLTDSGFYNGIMFGNYTGYWPIAAVGTLIGTMPSNLATPPAMTAANGIDFSAVTFSGAAFKSNGFSVSGYGVITGAFINAANDAAAAAAAVPINGLYRNGNAVQVRLT